MAADEWPSQPGLHTEKLDCEGLLGQRRKVQYYVPEGLSAAEPVPLVVALHGGISSPKNIRRRSMLNELADREKLVAAYPQGNGLFGLLLHWNAGFCCGKAVDKGIDDVAFVLEAIDRLAATVPVDTSRVYVLGFSNGAMLTYSIAAAHPDRIAGIAGVSGALGRVTPGGAIDWPIEPPPGGMPTIVIHGSADPRLPFDGDPEAGGGIGSVPVLESARFWARANGCATESEPPSGFDNVLRWAWQDCASGNPVTLYRLGGWGHRWSGRSPHTKADFTTVGSFETIEVIWEFFRAHGT
ncbi:MAG: PHB depolymerase family esterase [Pseudomonadota bacterium]